MTGNVGATGASGATGRIGLTGARGSTGATGEGGASGASGASGEHGATGTTGAAGSNGAAGSVGATGKVGVAGLAGSVGVAGSAHCSGAEFVSIVPLGKVAMRGGVVKYVIATAEAGRQLKIQFDAVNVVPKPLESIDGSVRGASCESFNSDYMYVCTNTEASFTIAVPLNSRKLSQSLDIGVIVMSASGTDCAYGTKSLPIKGTDDECQIVYDGAYCWDPATQCFYAECPPTSSEAEERRRMGGATALVHRVVLPMTFAVSYRRVKAHGHALRNSHESRCGPRFEFLVDGRVQFLSTERQFLSQGTLTFFGNATVLPGDMSKYEFRVVPTECAHSKLLIWNEHRLVLSTPKDDVLHNEEAFQAKKFANVNF
jgi:hypothetical protein